MTSQHRDDDDDGDDDKSQRWRIVTFRILVQDRRRHRALLGHQHLDGVRQQEPARRPDDEDRPVHIHRVGAVRRHGAHRDRSATGTARRRRQGAAVHMPDDVQTLDTEAYMLVRRHARLQQPLSEERRRAVLPDRAFHDAHLHRVVRGHHPAPVGVRASAAVLRARSRRLPARDRPGEARRHSLRARRGVRRHDQRLHSVVRRLHKAGIDCRRQRLGTSDSLQQRQRLHIANTGRIRHGPSAGRHLSWVAR